MARMGHLAWPSGSHSLRPREFGHNGPPFSLLLGSGRGTSAPAVVRAATRGGQCMRWGQKSRNRSATRPGWQDARDEVTGLMTYAGFVHQCADAVTARTSEVQPAVLLMLKATILRKMQKTLWN